MCNMRDGVRAQCLSTCNDMVAVTTTCQVPPGVTTGIVHYSAAEIVNRFEIFVITIGRKQRKL